MSTQNYSLDLFGQPEPLPDITAGKHGGNENSKSANDSIHDHKQADRVSIYQQAAALGWHGLTGKEVRIWHPTKRRWKQFNEYSGRLTELWTGDYEPPEGQKKLVLYRSGRKREGATVYVSEKRWITGGAE